MFTKDEDIPGSELSTYLYSETTSSELDILTWNRSTILLFFQLNYSYVKEWNKQPNHVFCS